MRTGSIFEFRLAPSEKSLITAASEHAGISASALVRTSALATARRLLKAGREQPAQRDSNDPESAG